MGPKDGATRHRLRSLTRASVCLLYCRRFGSLGCQPCNFKFEIAFRLARHLIISDHRHLFVRPVLALSTFSAPRRSPPRASLDSEVRWTRIKNEPRNIARAKGGA